MIADRDGLARRLDPEYRPDPAERAPRAAVAAVFRRPLTGEVGGSGRRTDNGAGHGSSDAPGTGDDTELLFIQRAKHEGDPWSGQMAFPGGRHEPSDPTLEATAARETLEEIGLDLSAAHPIGSLSELDGGRATNRRIVVSAHGWWLEGPRPTLTLNYEVADALWVPLRKLADPARHIDYLYPRSGMWFPGIQLDLDDQVIWGLTLRFVSDLFDRLGQPLMALDR